MANIVNAYSPYVVVPKLPTYNPYQRQQQQTNPSAYYTQALGFLPIDTRYLVNTTNRLAYNSMADVLFNAEAWDKRWEKSDYSWLSEWYGYIPRTIVDTALLIKDTQVDPVVQGITEDGWNGFLRGGSTALMNTLVNLGNTLDIVSNPIKGAVIEGFTPGGKDAWEGFTTGLFGDSQGRKQYDYADYINTGSGFLDTVLSLGLEIVSDPLNWISWGGKSAVKTGADTIADAVTKSIRSTLDDVLEQGLKSVDDITPKLVQSSKYFTDDTAKAFLNGIADESGNITKSAVNEFTNNLQPLLKKTITNAELAGGGTKGYRQVIKDLAQSKGSRYKVSLFSKVNMPPSTQMFVSNYLANASKNMPDLLSAGGKHLRYGARAYKIANNAESVLRWTAGSTGLSELVGLHKVGQKLKGWAGNVRAVRDPNVLKTLDDLYGILGQPENMDTVLETIKAVDDAAINDDFIKKLTPAINKYFNNLQGQSFLKKDLNKLTQLQTDTLTEINDLVKGLNIDGVENIADYIKHLNNNNAFTKNQAVSDFIKQLQTVNTELSKNFSDAKVRALYRKTIKHQGAVIDKVAKTMRTQGEQIDEMRKLYTEFKRKYNVPELSKQLTELDSEYDRVIENTIGKNTDTFSFEDSLEDIVIRAERALRDADNASDAEWLHANWLEFKGYVKDYTVNKTDLDVKRRLVESYQDLDNKLKSNLRFPKDEELNITSASEIKNKYGMPDLGGRRDTPIVTPAAKKIADITPEEKIILEKEKAILEALNKDAVYQKHASDIKQFAAENSDIDDIDGMLYEYIRVTYMRNKRLAGMSGAEAVNILKQAEDLRTLKPNADLILDNTSTTLLDTMYKNASLQELADAIEDLPSFNEVKRLDQYINPADIKKYKLIVYGIMNRQASIYNQLLGLDGAITKIGERITPIYSKTIFKDANTGVALTYLKENGRLPDEFTHHTSKAGVEGIVSAEAKAEFVNNLRIEATALYERIALHHKMGYYFYGYSWTELDAYAKVDTAFKEVWNLYNETLDSVAAHKLNPLTDDTTITNALNEIAERVQTKLDALPDNIIPVKAVNNSLLLEQQAKTLMQMSDEDILSLASFKKVDLFDKSPAYLKNLLDMYNDTTSTIYKILNDPVLLENESYKSTLEAAKEFFKRAKAYADTVDAIKVHAETIGLNEFYLEAILDGFVSQLRNLDNMSDYKLDTIVDNIIKDANVFLRNRFDTPSFAMDRVLRQVSNKHYRDEHAVFAENIKARLDKGLAHGAVADVDNWIDLAYLSKYSKDPRIAGMYDSLLKEADGKHIVVFDIESTGADETVSHIFQISGRVLTPDGIDTGIRFNYIVPPPEGVKPTPLVLETLAPIGEDPEVWWQTAIVGAKNTDTQFVCKNVDEALQRIMSDCSTVGPVMLAGHNIKAYDIPALIKNVHSSETLKTYFSTAKVFDSLSYMNTRTVFQLVGEEENIFKQQLKYILSDAVYSENATLKGVPFTGLDVNTLFELKQILKDNPQVSSKYFVNGKVVSEYEALKNAGFVGNTFGPTQDFDLDTFEQNLNGIINEWRTPAKVKGSGYFIVSKLNPDDLTEQMDAYFKELTELGLVSGRNTMVVPGKNIMNIMTSNVQRGTILINPVKVLSYEVENVFDLNKALNIYKTVDRANEMRFQDLARLTRIAKGVQKLRIFIPEDFIKEVKDTAVSFLKQAEEELPYLKCLHDNADDLTIVATAVYAYGRLNNNSSLKTIDGFKKLNYSDTMAMLRQQTPILHNIDKRTGLPQAVFIDDAYSYDTVTKFMKEDLRLESIKDYNIDKNLYNIHSAAKHAALEPVFELAKKIDNYYKNLGDSDVEAVRAVKHYNDALDAVAIKEILSSTSEELKATMYMRGGYIVFETNETISLNKFMDDNDLFVLDNVSTGDRYIHFICSKRGTLTASNDMDTVVKVVTDVEGVDKESIGLIEELRTMSSKSGLKNLYLSHGDTITEDTIDIIHNALIRAGVSEATIKQLVSIDDLKTMGFFDSVRANNSVIGNKTLWSYLTDDPDYYYITDPYKQLVYTMGDISKSRDQLTLYCGLLLNKHSSINDAELFKTLTDEELYTLLKKDEDMCLVYLTKSHYWDHTKSGIIAKEFDVVNAASITLARKMGGVHIMPRIQAAQLMQAVNEFELPPVARIVKSISDVYKVAYLGSLGFIVRNLIDSNYKTYVSLNGQVSLPKSVSHFFQSMHFVRKHTRIGQEYSKAMGEIFNSDLEYEVFYKYCKHFGTDNIVDVITADYSKQLRRKVVRQVEKLSQNFNNATLIKELQSDLIDPPMFSIIDSFINHGPSAGLSKTILSNLPSKKPQKTINGVADAVEQGLNNFNKVFTEKLPTKYIYGFNDTIEQAARLSMFLQRLELGDTVDGAIKGVIKAHFDYSDKTIGMLYTEMIFPFMSFSYKNLNFWIDMMSKNPMLIGQLENIFRPLLNYNSLFEPDQEAYEDYDYTFDWSKDVRSFQSNMPWTYINAARLYHILNGNIVIDRNKTVKHDSGYGEKDNELYTVFKLSPSVLDAVKMLYTPLNAYSERMLPPYETMLNIFSGMADGKNVVEEMNIASLANKLPYADTIMQRVGLDQNGLRHNNIFKRVEDNGAHQLIGSLFGTVYVPQKDDIYYYDSDYNILGGFKQNYYAKKNYSNPYNSKYPSYTLTRMAQNKKPRNIYARSKTNRAYNQQYNSIIRGTTSRILRNRIKDYNYYY